jgi:hypothetical protein
MIIDELKVLNDCNIHDCNIFVTGDVGINISGSNNMIHNCVIGYGIGNIEKLFTSYCFDSTVKNGDKEKCEYCHSRFKCYTMGA